jgi:hypothetical protein
MESDAERMMCIGETALCPCYRVRWNSDYNRLECPDGKPVDRFDLGDYSNIGDYQLEAFIIHKDTTSGGYDIYAIRVISSRIDRPEKAEIDFIYRTSPPTTP